MLYGSTMGLLDGIERLINEHGSSVILKERIALANDKYPRLNRSFQHLISESTILRLRMSVFALILKRRTFRSTNSKNESMVTKPSN